MPRDLSIAEHGFYSRIVRAYRLLYPKDSIGAVALCCAFIMHEGGPTPLATRYFNPFGYKWVTGKDEGRYKAVNLPGNEMDRRRGDDMVAYRAFDDYCFAIRSWHWQLFESPSYSDLLPLWVSKKYRSFAMYAYLRWSLNENHHIDALLDDWEKRLSDAGLWKPDVWPLS
jgi:hypothetical protein